jgi:alkylation response protein AidB-like acyl-CoA dehydrogenase
VAVGAAAPLGFDAGLWASLLDLGVVRMSVPDDVGGWGASMLDLCLVGECIGEHCASAPVVEVQVAARLLGRLGVPDLDRVLAGDALATLALHEPIDGVARLVPAGAVADLVLVRSGRTVAAVRHHAPPAPVPNHASLPLADVVVEGASVLAAGTDAEAAFEAAIDEWLLFSASALVGVAAGALRLAVDYARERRAFGSPIGAFQGIAHPLADVATAVDATRMLVHEAAWAYDSGLDGAAERACAAFAFASDAARQATYWGVHTLGGYGVMVEYDAQLFFRRARGTAGLFGDAEVAYVRAARHRYGPGGS